MWHANEQALHAEIEHRQATFRREVASARQAAEATRATFVDRASRWLAPPLLMPSCLWQALTLWRGA